MKTMEQSLANLVLRQTITHETALACTSRPDQLAGLLERSGYEMPVSDEPAPPLNLSLRVAGS